MNPPETPGTERTLQRKPRIEDAPAIFEGYAQDPEVTRYQIWKPHQIIRDTEQFLLACGRLWREGIDFPYAITLKEDDKLIGMFGLHPLKLKIEVGYVLARPYWGKGYMTEILQAAIEWALAQSDIFRVQAFCDVDNLGSARVMEKAGMEREGLLQSMFCVQTSATSRGMCILCDCSLSWTQLR